MDVHLNQNLNMCMLLRCQREETAPACGGEAQQRLPEGESSLQRHVQ